MGKLQENNKRKSRLHNRVLRAVRKYRAIYPSTNDKAVRRFATGEPAYRTEGMGKGRKDGIS